MPTHINLRYQELEEAWKGVEKYQALATQYGYTDIFADNAGKMVQLCVAVGLDGSSERAGPDGFDRIGNMYEVKTIDLAKKSKGFSTNHHLTTNTIERFRNRRFIFAVYLGITLHAAYLIEAEQLEPIFKKWEATLKDKSHINNPKIPVDFVLQNGVVMYMKDVAPAWAKSK